MTGAAQRLLWQGRGKPFLSAQSADRASMDWSAVRGAGIASQIETQFLLKRFFLRFFDIKNAVRYNGGEQKKGAIL